jgi:hypothetical protein
MVCPRKKVESLLYDNPNSQRVNQSPVALENPEVYAPDFLACYSVSWIILAKKEIEHVVPYSTSWLQGYLVLTGISLTSGILRPPIGIGSLTLEVELDGVRETSQVHSSDVVVQEGTEIHPVYYEGFPTS